MSYRADVVVIGSGIVGASIAYQLARRGVSVIAVDKGRGPAEGSTGASSSICRCRYTHPEVVRLAFHGQTAYGNWAEFTGLAEPRSGLERVGVLWMMGEGTDKVQADVDKLRSQGVEAENLGPDQVTDLFPALSTCAEPFDLSGESEHRCQPGEAFLFETTGGYADPVSANQDLIEATRARGGEVWFDSEVVGVVKEAGEVSGVKLADGSEISAGLTINENADATVRDDFERSFNHLVKEDEPFYHHTLEGSDDMPAHIKATLVGSSLTIPITDHTLNLGVWQGIYLCEFRNRGGRRKLVVTVYS